jgi:F0F1-type ATP synthase membrane subunit a
LKKLLQPKFLAKGIESISEITAQLISDIIATDNEKYFPIISVLFNFILFSNLMEIPYSFTATSHLIITFIIFSVLSE